ncbi:cation:proton antiporter [Sphingorhabdus sp.]|uniref:cation:proton antiporter n=1 Tax=Sphingorhabdus sp. TaxID=1902408 RepID=UPI00391BC6A3
MFEFSSYHIVLTIVGCAILFAHWLPRWISGREPAASALLIGAGYLSFAFIPGTPSPFNPVNAPKVWEMTSEICVVIGLFGVGIRIDRLRVWKNWQATVRLLAVAMPLTIAALAFLGVAAAGMTLATGLLLGAVLAPTDPVLASDVQVGPPLEGGEHPVRFTLTTEAGLNDGLAFPFLYLGMSLITASSWSLGLFAEWLAMDVAYRIAVGAASGLVLGRLVAKLLFDFPLENALSKTASGLVAFAGVLIVYGLTELLEGYGFIAVFLAGLTLRRSETNHEYHAKMHDFVEALERALTALLLVALGAAIPVLMPHLTWQVAAVSFALVFVIRPAAAWIALSRTALLSRERLVVAFYGIRGVGSIYYLSYAASYVALPNAPQLWAIVACTIVISTVVHGFTAGVAIERATT